MRTLRDRVAVITGGGGGIGLAMGRRFGHEGMKIVLADVRQEQLDSALKTLRDDGIEAVGVVTDVSDYASVQNLAKEAVNAFGAAHLVCNNAGVGSVSEGYIWEHDLADWRWGLDVNVMGVVHGIKAFMPILLEQEEGHVVNTSSGNGGWGPMATTAVYPATKAAVVTISESLYAHVRKAGARVGASVLFPGGPGWLRTDIWDSWKYRPQKYEPTQERRGGYNSMDTMVQAVQSSGGTVNYTPLESVANLVVEGVLADQFWLLPESENQSRVIRERTESMLKRENPMYFGDWDPKSPFYREVK